MSDFKVGDKVRVYRFYTQKDKELLSRDKIYKVISIDPGGYPVIEADQFNTFAMLPHQLKNALGFTFAEIIQMLLDKDLEPRTILRCDVVNQTPCFFYEVGRLTTGELGLRGVGETQGKPSVEISTDAINGLWTIEQSAKPTKEMTIEEIQEKLGHKIKIVE